MGKKKSAILFSLITLIIAVLIVVCYISFPCGDLYYYNSIISLTEKDADLGGYLIGETSYVGGGYSVVYYPEGVISAREYEETVAYKEGDELTEYTDKYFAAPNGAIYLEKEVASDDGETVSEEFEENFQKLVDLTTDRYESLHIDGTKVQVLDDYTIRVFLPYTSDSAAVAFEYLSYTGDFTLRFGDSSTEATTIIPKQYGTKHDLSYYLDGASVRSSSGSYYIVVDFTDEGQELVADATEEDTGSLYFYVGDNLVITLTVSEQIDQEKLYISSDNYTKESATIIATLLDTAIDSGDSEDLSVSLSDVTYLKAGLGENALMFLYIAVGALLLAMAIFFFVRYRRLAFVHIYSVLIYAIAMTLCVWAISSLAIGLNTVIAFLLGVVVLSVCNVAVFENARKEYAQGKTMTSSVKTAYTKCFWHIFDGHIALVLAAALMAIVGLTELAAFGLTLLLGALFSGVIALAVNRFLWYDMMSMSKNQGKFCHFARNVEEDEDE